MCILSSSAIAAAAAIAVTTAATTAVTLTQISAQKKATEYQIEQTKKEAKKAEMQAAYERQEGIESARRDKLNSILKMADEKAKISSSNLAMSSELVLNREDENKINSELDALTTKRNAERKAQIYLDKSNSLYNNAALTSYNNKVNTSLSYIGLGLTGFNNINKGFSSIKGALNEKSI